MLGNWFVAVIADVSEMFSEACHKGPSSLSHIHHLAGMTSDQRPRWSHAGKERLYMPKRQPGPWTEVSAHRYGQALHLAAVQGKVPGIVGPRYFRS